MAQADRRSMDITKRLRVAIADVNAGFTLLAAVGGMTYRMVGCKAIAVGGAVTTVTTIDIIGVLATATRKLCAFAQASLTQSTMLSAGGAGATILADGASFTTNDVATAITIAITGSAAAGATSIDFIITYTAEKA